MATLQERYDAAVLAAREISHEIEGLRVASQDAIPEELMSRRETALDDAEKLRGEIEAETKAATRLATAEQYLLNREPGDGPPPAIRQGAGQEELQARYDWQEQSMSYAGLGTEAERVRRVVRRTCHRELYAMRHADATQQEQWRGSHDAFDAYLRSLALPGGFGEAERHLLETVQDQGGGYTVPVDRRPEIIQRVAERAKIFQRCTQIPTSREAVSWLRIKEHASSPDIYSSGFVGSWVPSTPATGAGETAPVFAEMEIRIRKARSKAPLSNDWVADSALDVIDFLRDNGGENLGLVVDAGILAGTGVNNQPAGILEDADISIATNVSGTTADTISNTTSDAGSAPKLLDLHYLLPEQYVDGAVYVMRRSTEKEIRKLVDFNGRFLWEPGFGSEPNDFLGHPVLSSSFMEATGTDANKIILWGNLSGVIVAVRSDISVFINPYRLSDVEQTEFTLRLRLGVGIGNPASFKIGIV